MEAYTQEQFEQIPEFLRSEYTKQDDGTYVHGLSRTLKNNLNDLDGKNKSLQSQFDEIKEQMNTFESKKAEEIEAAKAKALDDARSKKDVEEIERQYQEQMADLERRTAERVKNETMTEFKKEQAEKDASALALNIATELAADSEAKDDLSALVSMRVKVDESGKIVFMNRDGTASTMTADDFKADVREKHKRLCKAEVTTTGGGLASGNTGGSANVTPSEKARSNLRARLKKQGLT